VTEPPTGFPDRPIEIVGYQVIVGAFQVTVPADKFRVTGFTRIRGVPRLREARVRGVSIGTPGHAPLLFHAAI
jgi:hypothetical protein